MYITCMHAYVSYCRIVICVMLMLCAITVSYVVSLQNYNLQFHNKQGRLSLSTDGAKCAMVNFGRGMNKKFNIINKSVNFVQKFNN